jgi:hypothetical protein
MLRACAIDCGKN